MPQEPTERYVQEVLQVVLEQYVWCGSGDVHNVHFPVGIVLVAGVEAMMWEGLGYRL